MLHFGSRGIKVDISEQVYMDDLLPEYMTQRVV